MTEISVENTDSGDNVSWLRIIKILLIVIFSCVILLGFFSPGTIPRESANRIKCNAYLRSLSIALYMYAHDHSNSYPIPDNWCDLLIKDYKVSLEYLVCSGSDAKIGESSYALNKNIEGKKSSEIPSDTVLLFETLGGWNQVGGPEMLTTDNHKGKGCNILFNDRHVEFVKAERIGELKWGTEKIGKESVE